MLPIAIKKKHFLIGENMLKHASAIFRKCAILDMYRRQQSMPQTVMLRVGEGRYLEKSSLNKPVCSVTEQ